MKSGRLGPGRRHAKRKPGIERSRGGDASSWLESRSPVVGLRLARVGNRSRSVAKVGTMGCGRAPDRVFYLRRKGRLELVAWYPELRRCAPATRFRLWSVRHPFTLV